MSAMLQLGLERKAAMKCCVLKIAVLFFIFNVLVLSQPRQEAFALQDPDMQTEEELRQDLKNEEIAERNELKRYDAQSGEIDREEQIEDGTGEDENLREEEDLADHESLEDNLDSFRR